ncbi:MAG: hypothetical protein AAF799_36650 [Myxococcota bacterium]
MSELPGVDELRSKLERDARDVPTDFADVMARMRANADDDEDVVGADAVAGSGAESLDPAELESEADRVALAPACEALRERIEASLAEADMPPLAVVEKRRPVVGWVIGAVVLAAAAVVLTWQVPQLLSQQPRERVDNLASDERRLDGDNGGQAVQGVESETVTPRRTVKAPEPAPQPAVEVEPEPEPEPAVEAEPEPEPEAKTNRRSRAERLRILDERAQSRWKAGDVQGAQKIYRALVRVGGRHPRVELAYAELFALGRQRGEDLAPLWRAYLRRFPNGRYTREAKAGLCRQASGSKRKQCWAEYAERFPESGHE